MLGPAQVNAALAAIVGVTTLTGVASWAAPDSVGGPLTTVHAVVGLMTVALIPSKAYGPMRSGLGRNVGPSDSAWRGASILLAVSLLSALGFGVVHAAGIGYGVGVWSPLWTHQLLGFVAAGLTVVHMGSRSARPKRSDLGRRSLIRLAGVAAGAAVLRVGHQPVRRSLAASEHRHTGSYETASYDPDNLPTVFWINDRPPADTTADEWPLTIQGLSVGVSDLWEMTTSVDAVLDCTGGWWSAQRWDAVPLSTLMAAQRGRSVRVTSATGYTRWYPMDGLEEVFLAVGYGGRPLKRGHGAPVRLVVPGRRGPEWVKWVTDISVSDRPAWLSSPLPLS